MTLDNVYESDIGTWKCKAMFWEDWSEANLEVAMFETDSAEVGFHILYGEVDVEIGKIKINRIQTWPRKPKLLHICH